MRFVYYYVINKETHETAYVDCRKSKAEEFLANLSDAENYVITFKGVRI